MMFVPPELSGPLRAAEWFTSVDPGLRYPAAAVWSRGRLVRASRVKIPGALRELGRADRCRQVGRLIASWVLEVTGQRSPAAVALEWPQVYAHGKGKGDPNDLLPLAGIDVAVACYLDCEVLDALPREWIGSINKTERGDPWVSPRGHITRQRLSPEEFAAVVPSHDAVDAVAIGLKFLGRLERVLPGTT